MDELVKLVTDKVGISPDQAQKAVTVVMGFLKERLPAPLAGELDKVLAGGTSGSAGAVAGAAESALGGLFK
jgi:uncharacterized protein (DUF2267 family)